MSVAKKKENIPLGIAVIIATVFSMAFADAVVKYVSSELPLWQIFVVRSLIALPVLIALCSIFHNGNINPKDAGWTIFRSFLLAFMYIAIYAAAPIVSLTVIAASLYTSPLFITLFSSVLLKEKVGPVRWMAILCGFTGVLIIIRPDADEFTIAMLVPILAAIFYALTAVITRGKCSDEEPMVLALYLSYALLVVGLIMTLIFTVWAPLGLEAKNSYPFLFGDWISMGPTEWGVIGFLALLIVIIGIGLAFAYQSAPSAIIATFDYSYLIFAVFWGFVIFADVPTAVTFIGMSLIVASGLLVIFSERIEQVFYRQNAEQES